MTHEATEVELHPMEKLQKSFTLNAQPDPKNNMSNPLNTIETDIKKSSHIASDWISSTAENAYHDAEDGVIDLIDRSKELYQNARKQISRQACEFGVFTHNNAYSAILIGIGVGTLLGYLLVRRNKE